MTPIAVRIDVEGMQYHILQAFNQHHGEIEEEIERCLGDALKNFDFAAIVRETVTNRLREAVKTSIASACSKVMWENPIRDLIEAGAAHKVREAIEESLK